MMTNECGTNRIAGCQFTLFPMSEDFVDVILSALEQVDTQRFGKKQTTSAHVSAEKWSMFLT